MRKRYREIERERVEIKKETDRYIERYRVGVREGEIGKEERYTPIIFLLPHHPFYFTRSFPNIVKNNPHLVF